MKKLSQSAPLLLFLFLTACGTTSAEMRAAPGESGSFQVDLPYVTVLKNFSRCADQGAGGYGYSYFYWMVKENAAENSATIDFLQDGIARRVLTSVDIAADGKNTKVTYYKHHMFAVFKSIRQDIEDQARGVYKCGDKEPG